MKQVEESKNAKNVRVHTLLKVEQEGIKEEFLTIEEGQLFRKAGAIFIKYEEKITIDHQSHNTNVLVKLLENGALEIVRSGATRMKLRFVLGQEVPSSLQSGHGAMALSTKASKIDHQVLGEDKGKVCLDYELYSAGERLGTYEFVLSYE